MSDTEASLLQQAYKLIENEDLEAAQELLAPLLEDDANNVHLWWVYTHALRDSGIGQAALERVLELDPKYPGARELKADVLDAQAKDPDLIALEASEPGAAQSLSESGIDDWEDLQPVAEAGDDGQPSTARLAILGILITIVIGGGLVLTGAIDLSPLLSVILQSPEPQVVVVSEPTGEPGASEGEAEGATTLEELPATAAATASATTEAEAEAPPEVDAAEVAAFLGLVAAAIDEVEIDQAESGIISTELGSTLVLRVCAIPGPELNERLYTLLTSVASVAEDLPANIEAVAAGLLNCDDPSANLRVIGVARKAINEFAKNAMDARDYQRAWQPLS